MKQYLLFILLMVSFQSSLVGQTFATIISSENEVDLSSNAMDGNLSSSATIRSISGIALGIGAYDGHLEIEFPATLNQNTTSYVKLDTQDNILPYLLGGSLGGLLSDIAGAVLLGNQEFTLTVKNNNVTVLEESSSAANAFSTDLLKVVTNVNNDYFIAIAPNAQYNRIRLTNQIGSLIGLNNTRNLDVFGAYYSTDPSICGMPTYTSFDGSGLTLDLIGLGGAGVTDANLAIDGDLNTYSEIGLGILGVAASIEQTVHFDSLSEAADNFYIRLATDPSLLSLGIADNIQVIAQNGSDSPIFSESLSSLLDLDLLGLLENGQAITIPIDPAGQVNRVTLQLSSLLNVDIAQSINLYGVYRAPASPELDANSQDISICSGESINLVATTGAGNELRWYDSESGGTLLDTVNSGDPYTTPPLTSDSTYYLAAAVTGCPEESPRIAVEVKVVDVPTAVDIDITGDESPICSSNEVVLTPTSSIDGIYTWFFDVNATSEITDGMVVGSVIYSIDSDDGSLTINGLDQAGSPYNYFTRITEASASCENASGDLQSATVNVVDSGASVTISSSLPVITLDILANLFQSNPTFTVSGSVSGDTSPGDAIILTVDGQSYSGTLDGSLGFDIDVDGTNLALDPNGIIDVFIDGGLCTLTGEISVDLPILEIDETVQIFCASDKPTLLDLAVTSNNIVFFDSLDALVSLDMDTPLVDGQVYFAGILDVPISILPRVGITVNLTNPLPPTTNETTQTFCAVDNPTITDIQVNESNILFYSDASGNNPLDISTSLVNGASYFVASVDVDGCISTTLLEISILIQGDIPTTNSITQTFCINSGATLADVQVNESNILFYSDASGNDPLDISTPLVGGASYFVASISVNGCISNSLLEISIILDEDDPRSLTGQTEEACIGEDYIYTTESGKQNYIWSITGGTILDGGSTSDDFVTVSWNSLENNSINVQYEDPTSCIPTEPLQVEILTIECGEVLGEEFCLKVYNEFSPNDDGYNDFFEIECIENYSNTIEVYNRNGNKVFQEADYGNTWNGIANVNGILNKGDHLPSGTYYYVINIPELNRNIIGWLQLAR